MFFKDGHLSWRITTEGYVFGSISANLSAVIPRPERSEGAYGAPRNDGGAPASHAANHL